MSTDASDNASADTHVHASADDALTVLLTVRGRVQGVGFRWSLCAEAESLGLVGWVRNRRDGSVEALLRGRQAKIDTLVTWARRGPPAAAVSAVEVSACSAGEAATPLAGFRQLPTA